MVYLQACSNRHRISLETLNLKITSINPHRGWVKLNVDRPPRLGHITGGRIIRRDYGSMVIRSSSFYEEGTNNQEEGLMLCDALRFTKVINESDSALVLMTLRKNVQWNGG